MTQSLHPASPALHFARACSGIDQHADRAQSLANIRAYIVDTLGYSIVEAEEQKPWGAYYRIDSTEADRFVRDFFPGLSPTEARLGNPSAELSPKILVVYAGQRLSWQFHYRRAERWHFLTPGSYHRSLDDDQHDPVSAEAGDIVQFATNERHRLCADAQQYTIVAEIWQHTQAGAPSDESDIVRLADDYQR